jgi:hypothetical protein
MTVAWYGVKVWRLTSPDGMHINWGTRLSHSLVWDMWTVTRDNGATSQVPLNVRGKYDGLCAISYAYDADPRDGAEPTAALARVEYEGANPIDPADVYVMLDTKAKWDAAMAQYPTLKARFTDQPYYPAEG